MEKGRESTKVGNSGDAIERMDTEFFCCVGVRREVVLVEHDLYCTVISQAECYGEIKVAVTMHAAFQGMPAVRMRQLKRPLVARGSCYNDFALSQPHFAFGLARISPTPGPGTRTLWFMSEE